MGVSYVTGTDIGGLMVACSPGGHQDFHLDLSDSDRHSLDLQSVLEELGVDFPHKAGFHVL